MLAFGDPLDGALGQDLDVAKKRMAAGVVRERGQSLGQLRFGAPEGGACLAALKKYIKTTGGSYFAP